MKVDAQLPKLDSPAHQVLTAALTNAADHGQFIACASWGDEDNPWLADSADDRAWAAERCTGCPVISECRQAGQAEKFGVWGAIDQTPTKTSAQPARTKVGGNQS